MTKKEIIKYSIICFVVLIVCFISIYMLTDIGWFEIILGQNMLKSYSSYWPFIGKLSRYWTIISIPATIFFVFITIKYFKLYKLVSHGGFEAYEAEQKAKKLKVLEEQQRKIEEEKKRLG